MKTLILGGITAAAIFGGVPAVLAVTGFTVHEPTTSVTSVIDGDTVVISGGERVRLIGIDTPEANECDHDEAAEALRSMVEGRSVTLPNPDSVDDTDRYGRLLRYIDVGDQDAGYSQLVGGYAEARYDSRDGYQEHPREELYRAVSDTSDTRCEKRYLKKSQDEARDAGIDFDDDDDPNRLRKLAIAAWIAAERRADRAGLERRKNETLPELDRRSERAWDKALAKAALVGLTKQKGETVPELRERARLVAEQQRAAEQARIAQQNRETRLQEEQPAAPVEDDWKPSNPTREEEPDYLYEESIMTEYVPPAPTYDPPSSGGSSSYTGPRCYAPGGRTWSPC